MRRICPALLLILSACLILTMGSCRETSRATTGENADTLTGVESGAPATQPAQPNPPTNPADAGGDDQSSGDVPEPRGGDPENQPSGAADRFVEPFAGIRVNLARREVHFDAVVCLTEGWLEQIVCSPNTREHESLLVSDVRPSNLHAAMLVAGYEAGSPGRWKYEDDSYSVIPPQGTAVYVFVRYQNAEGETIEHRINQWVRDHLGENQFPDQPWIFGGSRIAANPESMGEGEHYVADMTGSIIGLVTFGDELLGWKEVLSDQAAVSEPEWEANGRAMPDVGTKVTVILRRAASE